MEPLFDEDWHARALDGDSDALTSLVETHYGPLLAYCLSRARGDADVCRDVVQESFVRAVESLDRYRPAQCGGRPFKWLSGLARNELRRARSRNRPERSLDTLLAKTDAKTVAALARIDADPLSDEALGAEATSALVEATLARLRPAERSILAAKYIEGLSVRTLAARLGLDEGAVESRLGRARVKFRQTFARCAKASLDGGQRERRAS